MTTQFVVVGAGPAGCSAALKAARIPDVQVKVIEKRSFQSVFEAKNNPRSYPMVLSGRALGLFEDLGLDLPSTREPYHGIEFLPSKGSLKFPNPNRCALVSRSQLALNLLYEAARHPSISIYFGASPAAIDVSNNTISLVHTSSHTDDSTLVLEHLLQESPMLSQHAESAAAAAALEQSSHAEHAVGGHVTHAHHAHGDSAVSIQEAAEPEKLMSTVRMAGMQTAIALQARQGAEELLPERLEYDFLVAADGALSKVREMLTREGMLSDKEVLTRTDGYKTFTDIDIPEEAKADCEQFPFVTPTMKSCQQLWFVVPQKESNSDMRIVIWRSDSDHVCGMVPGQQKDAEQLTAEWMLEHFGENIPDWFRQPFCDQMNASKAHSWGSIRTVSQFHAPNVVLLGDAAHAVTSTLGQGCNMALESVRVFGRVLDSSIESEATVSDALAKVPEQFTELREADARAMQRMEQLHSVLQGVHGESEVDVYTAIHARVAWGSAFMLGLVQWKLMPDKYRTVPIYEKIYDENVPYSDVLAYVTRVGLVAYTVLAVAMSTLTVNVWQVFGTS